MRYLRPIVRPTRSLFGAAVAEAFPTGWFFDFMLVRAILPSQPVQFQASVAPAGRDRIRAARAS